MGISFKNVLLLSILILQSSSAKEPEIKSPVSPCCRQNFLNLLPCACPVKVQPVYHVNKCPPPKCVNAELEKIFKEGSSTILDYTSKATGPVIFVAEAVNNGADLIPMAFAAGGNLLGSAISGPLKFFNKLGFGFLTGAISQVISIPISLSTSAKASIISIQPFLERIMSIGNSCCSQTTKTPLFPEGFGQVLMKPIGILTGATHIALGKMLNIGGSTFKLIGILTQYGGEFSENIGYNLKTQGSFKVTEGVDSVAGFIKKLEQSANPVIGIHNGNNMLFYECEDKKVDNKIKIEKIEPSTLKATTSKYIEMTTVKTIKPIATKYPATATTYPLTTIKLTTPYVPLTTPYVPLTTTESYIPVTKPIIKTTTSITPESYEPDYNKKTYPDSVFGSPVVTKTPEPYEPSEETAFTGAPETANAADDNEDAINYESDEEAI